MRNFNFSLNCALKDYQFNMSEGYDNTTMESASRELNVFEFGTLTGISIALVIDVLSIQYAHYGTSSLKTKLTKIFNAKTLSRTLLLTILVLVLPVVTVFFLLVLLYKLLCSVAIKRKDRHFVEFLDSFDVFWSLENDTTKSVINVLGIIESDSPNAIANNIVEKLQKIFPNNGTRKIFYRRNEKYGFYYWRKYSFIDMNEYVEIVEFPNRINLDVTDLENLMTDVQNHSLPYDDEGLFKILITKQRVGNYDEDRGEYGIIFRIHHSVGDGVALIEFLCQTLADKTEDCPINMFSIPDQCRADSPYDILGMMHKLCEMPICFADGILRKPDGNSLHGPSLVGKKVFKWTVSDENLLTMVKDIKENVEQLNFTDVLLTALSSGLRIFFSKTMAPIPEDIAVVIPIRFPKTTAVNNDLALTNDFSVTILNLPVNEEGNMEEVKSRCNDLRRSADPLTNYYFLKIVSSILPKSILQPLLNSSQATMVFSNMPGPERLNICGGNALKSLVFFVPHKGTTGLGVTALCYGGVLRFALMADAAISPNPDDLALILDGMVEEIRRLHKHYVAK